MKYEQYQGQEKTDRKKMISESETLNEKRFVLSSNPELTRELKIIKEVFREMQDEFPEIVSFGLFGSMVKGYANEESDLDLVIFFDNSKGYHSKNTYEKRLIELVANKKMNPRILSIEHLHNISEDTLQIMMNDIEQGMITRIRDLFLISLGQEIKKYRKVILDELETKGQLGQKIWTDIIESLWNFENKGFSEELRQQRRKLYPWTLIEARISYLSEKPDEIT